MTYIGKTSDDINNGRQVNHMEGERERERGCKGNLKRKQRKIAHY